MVGTVATTALHKATSLWGTVVSTALYKTTSLMGTVAITALFKATSMVGTVPITALYKTASVVGTVDITALFMPPLFVECGRALSVAHVRPFVLPFVHHLGRYFVSATPPTIFSQSFWNFTGVFVKDWKCAWHLDITLRLIFVTFFTVWT